MRPCKYFLEGRCAFGSRCRNIHGRQREDRTPNEDNDNDVYNLLDQCWDQLVWKGSPLWKKGSVEPFFYGLNLCIDELRWKFYSRPSQDWLLYQQNIDNYLEQARRLCLRQRYSKKFTSSKNFQVPIVKIFSTQSFHSPPMFSPHTFITSPSSSLPLWSSSQNQPVLTQSLMFESSITNSITQPIHLHPVLENANADARNRETSLNFSLPFKKNLNNPIHPITSNVILTTPNIAPKQASHISGDQPLSGADFLKSYPKELVNYHPDDLDAFLAPEFQPNKIPVKPPPTMFR